MSFRLPIQFQVGRPLHPEWHLGSTDRRPSNRQVRGRDSRTAAVRVKKRRQDHKSAVRASRDSRTSWCGGKETPALHI